MPNPSTPIPVLLLKTPSPTPSTDPYTTHLTTISSTTTYTPHFVPVLQHTLLPDPLIKLLLAHLNATPPQPFQYGALIFTSQRAVAAFASALQAAPIQKLKDTLSHLDVRLYTVGPGTALALRNVVEGMMMPRCRVLGGERAGSGEVLARLMLGENGEEEEVYDVRSEEGRGKKGVLFLTGEKRRDVIPRMLMDGGLGERERVQVDEMVVYETSELGEFAFCFGQVLERTGVEGRGRWVVVFSPTAGKGMLKALGWLDEGSGRVRGDLGERSTFVACIGPTTREYLYKEFGFAADVVAEKPSPQGIKNAIEDFMKSRVS